MLRFKGAQITWFGLAVLAFAGGCTSIAEKLIEKPKIALAQVQLKDVSPAGATVIFGVEVDNPNPFALKIDALRYDLEIGGRKVGAGQIDQAAEVAGKSKGVIPVPVPVKFSDLFASLGEFLSKTTSDYRVSGEAKFGLLTIPFDEKGALKLK